MSSDAVLVWFGVPCLVNMQMSFQSPPFGYALFYIRRVPPPEITMATIFRSSLVFLFRQIVGLALVVTFPARAARAAGAGLFKALKGIDVRPIRLKTGSASFAGRLA